MTCAHVRALARYNAPLYRAGVIGVGVAAAVALTPAVPVALRIVAALLGAVAGWYILASLVAFHWMFDRSELLGGRWLRTAEPPSRWVQISLCLEQTLLPMAQVFPEAEGVDFDLFDPSTTAEPAVGRARSEPRTPHVAARPDHIDRPDGWSDLTVVTLAAHELRQAAHREALFRELRRITNPEGRLVLVEHPRNLPAWLAFGPGVGHFLPRGEWRRLAAAVGLDIHARRSITPFVDVWELRPASPLARE